MRTLVRVLLATVVLVAAGGWSWSQTGAACACSCVPWTSQQTADRADAIVVGRAVSATEVGSDRHYEFQVEASYKTQVRRQIVVETASQAPACGVELEIGETTTLVLHRDAGAYGAVRWSTYSCINHFNPGERPITDLAGPRFAPLAGGDEVRGSEPGGGTLLGVVWIPTLTFALFAAFVIAAGLVAGLVWLVRRRR